MEKSTQIGGVGDVLTIVDLENAINYFHRLTPPVGGVVSTQVRKLADVYGVMICEKRVRVLLSTLNDSQRAAISEYNAAQAQHATDDVPEPELLLSPAP